MEPLTSRLPADQRGRLSPGFLANERDYLRMREELLATHPGQWVAIESGRIVASGEGLIPVMARALEIAPGTHPFIALVGEEEIEFRIRREEFAYDASYRPHPMPRLEVTFRDFSGNVAGTFPDVIPDTGADISVLPQADCEALGLENSPPQALISRGVMGPGISAVAYFARAEIDGRSVIAIVQPVAGGSERIVGREVLNEFRVTFDGPAGRLIVEG